MQANKKVFLIGCSHVLDAVRPVWRGNYPRGLSKSQFEQARKIRRELHSQGKRNADVQDALEKAFPRLERVRDTGTLETSGANTGSIESVWVNLKEVLRLKQIKPEIKWHRQFAATYFDYQLGDYGQVDILALSKKENAIFLAEVFINRDSREIVESLMSYLIVLSEAFENKGISVSGGIVARNPTSELRQLAKDHDLVLLNTIIKVEQSLTHVGARRIQVKFEASK